MRIKLKFPENITANSLCKAATKYTTVEELNALEHGRLVVAWDTPKNEGSPNRFYGFLKEIRFSSDGSVKYEVFCPTCDCTLGFDTVKVVQELACPKVYYNDDDLQGVGTLVGILQGVDTSLGKNDDQRIDCRIRVAPWSETVYRTVGVDQLAFVENIPLGITEKDDEETDNVQQ